MLSDIHIFTCVSVRGLSHVEDRLIIILDKIKLIRLTLSESQWNEIIDICSQFNQGTLFKMYAHELSD